MITGKVKQYIEKEQLFAPHEKLLVALSGGADSVALLRVLLQLGYSCEAAHCNFHLRGAESDRDENTACFDAGKIQHPLDLRLWRQGDTFVPFGMKGKKKVSDYLTDRKFSLVQKEQQWVLCCGNDIIWLVGERTDNRYRVDEHTRKILIVKLLTR